MNKIRLLTSVAITGLILVLVTGLALSQTVQASDAMGYGFTYQGHLIFKGEPYTGTCDFLFELFDAPSGGKQIGSTNKLVEVTVTNGLFTVLVDFGPNSFTGEGRWIEILVTCPSGIGDMIPLTPRQQLTPAPYALALPGLYTQHQPISPNLVGGSSSNNVSPGVHGAVIGGGGSSIWPNTITDSYGVIGGGMGNQAGNDDPDLDSWTATVGGGRWNEASGRRSTVGGGGSNTASGWYSTVSGGWANEASGSYSTVPGGSHNTAQGNFSLAAGRMAQANAQGCFVWGDSTFADIECNVTNRWVARASGGVYFYTNSGLTSGAFLSSGGTSWNAVSNRDLKENFTPVDTSALLAALAQYPITTWNYQSQDESIVHIGMMADEFNSLIDGLGGEGEDYINTMDAVGVSLAAIQGLYTENQDLRAQVDDLEARLSALEEVLDNKQVTHNTSTGWPISWLLGFGLITFSGVWVMRQRQGDDL